MTRMEDYHNARDIAAAELADRRLPEVARAAGLAQPAADILEIPFLDRRYRMRFPDCAFEDGDDRLREVPIQEQVLLLHYLTARAHPALTGRWIAYREIPGAAFYYTAFVKRAVNPLKRAFGQDLDAFRRAAAKLQGRPVAAGDAGFDFELLPKAVLELILYAGDEEFDPEANVLFDANASEIFSPEDAAWLAGMLVYRLIARAHQA